MTISPPAVMHNVQAAVPILQGEAAMPQRILIIEDGPVLAKNMKTYLSRGSCEVRTAADAAQAFAMLDSFAPDTLIRPPPGAQDRRRDDHRRLERTTRPGCARPGHSPRHLQTVSLFRLAAAPRRARRNDRRRCA